MTITDDEACNTAHDARSGTIVFEQLFREHFERLYKYAYTIVKNETIAEEIVQQVFSRLWEIKDSVQWGGQIAAYLYKATYTNALNILKHDKVKHDYRMHILAQHSEMANTADPAELKELEEKIVMALNALPNQCRTVFHMSRFEGLKYKDIAARLGISVKTVENHMCKALEFLRKKLADYLPVLCVLFINIKNWMP